MARIALIYVALFWGMSWLAFRYLYDWGMSAMGVGGIAISIAATVFAFILARTHLRAELASISKPALILMAVSAAVFQSWFYMGHGAWRSDACDVEAFYLMPVDGFDV